MSTPTVRQGVPIGTNQAPWKRGLPKGISGAAMCTSNASAPAASAYALIVPTAIGATAAGQGAPSQADATPVATSLSGGVFCHKVGELTNRLNFKFFLSDANDETGMAYLFTLRRLIDGNVHEWVGNYEGSLALTAGTKVIDSGSLIVPSVMQDNEFVYWADTITPTDDSFNDSWEVWSDTANGAAVASVDSYGAEYFVMVLTRNGGTCESLGFIWSDN